MLSGGGRTTPHLRLRHRTATHRCSPVRRRRGVGRDRLQGKWQLAEGQFFEGNLLTGVVDIDAYYIASFVIIQYHPLGDFPALDTGCLREVNVEGIRVRIIAELHGLNPRSGKALWMVILSSRVATRNTRPSSSSIRPQNR